MRWVRALHWVSKPRLSENLPTTVRDPYLGPMKRGQSVECQGEICGNFKEGDITGSHVHTGAQPKSQGFVLYIYLHFAGDLRIPAIHDVGPDISHFGLSLRIQTQRINNAKNGLGLWACPMQCVYKLPNFTSDF